MNKMDLEIPDEVFDFFVVDPVGPMLTLARAADDSSCPVHSQLNLFLETIPPATVANACKDPQFLWFCNRATNIDHQARIWIAERFMSKEISRRRTQLLCKEREATRPNPYGTSSLADMDVDSEHLVRLSEFRFDGARLIRNGYAFTVLSTTNSPNSTYWLLNMLYSEGLSERTSVRLDPFLFGPVDSFPAVFYRMLVYGRPLNWERISSLRGVEHGRWFPSSLSHRSEFTDFCWEQRDDEIHFFCEEVPLISVVAEEASRYLHAVYEPKSATIGHLDGAIRLFTAEEIELRRSLHVRKSGKLGVREKVFRMDEQIPRESFSALTQAFFVWNEDVVKYLHCDLGQDLTHSGHD